MNNEIKLLAPPKGDTYEIPEENLGRLEEKIAKLNKSAEKLGCKPIKLDVFNKVVHKNAETGEVTVNYQVYVEGEAPKLKGWTFLGALTHAPEGNIVRLVPGKSVPESYRTSKPVCDYCKKDWIVRRDTYIVHCDIKTGWSRLGRCMKEVLK